MTTVTDQENLIKASKCDPDEHFLRDELDNIIAKWTVTIEEAQDGSGDLLLPLPQELLDKMEWVEGDIFNWTDNKDGSWILEKVKHD